MNQGHHPVASSFRDPAGRLYTVDGELVRTVRESFAPDFSAFLDSGLYEAVVRDGLLVEHEELDPRDAPEQCWRLLRPHRLPFVSHPWEWSPGQLRAAALLTLELQDRALDHGLSLRDASAFNVQFHGHRPVFIDTLSFGRLEEGRPWAAYGQFCRHFLAPLALRAILDPRLADLQLAHMDGVPLDLASRLLPRRTRVRPGLALHLHWHARSTSRGARRTETTVRTARFGLRALKGLVSQLRSIVTRLTWRPAPSVWSEYTRSATHYDADAASAKAATLRRWVERLDPATVLDLGANTGVYSRVAAERGADVVALDGDDAAVEIAFRELEEDPPSSGTVLPLRTDLANPSPSVGWDNDERLALLRRVRSDLVLALAVVHHLVIANEVPVDRVLGSLAALGGHLAVEWVPPADPKVQQLLSTRPHRAAGYTEEAFTAAVAAVGRVRESVPLGETGRVVHLVESR